MNYDIGEDEVILYKGDVKYSINEKNIDAKYILTSKKMIIEEKKKKDLIDIIGLDEIKVHNDKVQCKQNFCELYIQSKRNSFSITFNNVFDAIKVWNLIVDNITGTHIIKRGLKKAKESLDIVDETLDVVDQAKGIMVKGLIGRKK